MVGIFSEVQPLFGVDAAGDFMMVLVGGFNLIYHSLGKCASFTVTPTHRGLFNQRCDR